MAQGLQRNQIKSNQPLSLVFLGLFVLVVLTYNPAPVQLQYRTGPDPCRFITPPYSYSTVYDRVIVLPLNNCREPCLDNAIPSPWNLNQIAAWAR